MPDRRAPAAGNNSFVDLLSSVRPRVDDALAAALGDELEVHDGTGREVVAMIDAAQSLCLRGGKRMRAALVFAGLEAASPNTRRLSRDALEFAVAVELLQSYFLIHDDWMDQDRQRRGGDAVHVMLEKQLQNTHLGASSSILAGDFLAALATRVVARAAGGLPDADAAQVAELVVTFSNMQLQAVAGQQLDVAGLTRDAEKTYGLKTGSYTVLGPLHLGALLAPRDGKTATAQKDTLEALERFALPIGVAFQIKDDLIGLFSTSEQSGKPFGADLGAGKWTWVVQHALAHGDMEHRSALQAVLGDTSAGPAALETAIRAIDECGARDAAEARIDELLAEALAALETDQLTTRGRRLLADAAAVLVRRDA